MHLCQLQSRWFPITIQGAWSLQGNAPSEEIWGTHPKMSSAGGKWRMGKARGGELLAGTFLKRPWNLIFIHIIYYVHLLNVPFICIQTDCRVAALTNVCTFCKVELHYYWNDHYKKVHLSLISKYSFQGISI